MPRSLDLTMTDVPPTTTGRGRRWLAALGWRFDTPGRDDLRCSERPSDALDVTTDASDAGLRDGLLTHAEHLDPPREPSKARVHAALFGDQPLPPERFGRFMLRGTLGRGGMGTVLEAYDPTLDRTLALKVLHPTVPGRHAQRLLREALALAKLSHPNVVHVYEVGEVEGRTFIAMERVRGQTLREWQDQRPRPDWRACVATYLQAGQGLAAAHAAGLVHRDFTPNNCIIDETGRVRVLDFGLVRGLEEPTDDEASSAERPRQIADERLTESLTRTGAVLGTVAYMPLEQLEGRPVDARADQFAFCLSLYEALYGERPFCDDSLAERSKALEHGEVRPAPGGSDVPGRLRAVLLRGLSVDPAARWPSMAELLTELRHTVAPRIRVVSKAVELGALALFWVTMIFGILGAGALVRDHLRGTLAVDAIFYIRLHMTVTVLLSAAILRHVAKLAALYTRGKLFTADNVRHLRAVGWLLMPLSVGIGFMGPTPRLDFQPTMIVAGLLFVFVSWVMDEARRLE